MSAAIEYRGLLVGTYRPGKPALSGFHTPPFHDDLDFESYRLMGRASWPASRVTYERKYELLGEILGIIRREAAGLFDEILVYSRMPSIMRMPKPLFGADVFFLLGLEDECERLAAEGVRLFALREGFLRHALEDGDNRMSLRWFNAPDGAAAVMERIAAGLSACGLDGAVVAEAD